MTSLQKDTDPSAGLVASFRRGRLSRRDVLRRAAGLGLSAPAIAAILAACGGGSSPTPTATAGQTATTTAAASPSATGAPATATAPPSTEAPSGTPTTSGGAATPGTTGAALGTPSKAQLGAAGGLGPGPTQRGAAGTIKILYWQAPTILNPHLGTGPKDIDPSRLVYEPLADFTDEGTLVPWLAAEIPSLDNGGVAKDGKTVTWKLKPDITWSDGQPFTADDCVFTWKYVSNKETGAVTIGNYQSIASVEAPDPTTVKITFAQPTAAWYLPFTDAVLPEHVFKEYAGANAKQAPPNIKPVGTGPYVVDQFTPGDSVTYSVNPHWRDPNGPAFDHVDWKGGGDAVSAARSVLQTGEYQLAWNLQVDPAVLNAMVKGAGDRAKLGFQPGNGVEQVLFNFSDPNKEVDGQRSHYGTPHPFLSDLQVRQALNLIADRKQISDLLYGEAGQPWALLQNAPASALPTDLTWQFDLAKANQMLDAAGWPKSGQVRAKDGVQMTVVIQATNNSVRTKEMEILKAALEQVGITAQIKAVEASVYFSSDPGNPDTFQKFYADMEITTYPAGGADPQRFLNLLTTAQIAQKENNWAFGNVWRFSDPKFDQLNEQSRNEIDPVKRNDLFRQQYTILYNDAVGLPLVGRSFVFAQASDISGIHGQPWAALSWNIANWVKG